jgi:hypothetical protein
LNLLGQEKSINQLTNQELPLRTILRLLCLYSLVSGGIKPRLFGSLKRDLLQTYGYKHVNPLIKLSTLSLLTNTGSSGGGGVASGVPGLIMSGMSLMGGRSAFSGARKPLKRIVNELDGPDPNDISYTYSGYAPLSVRIVESICFDKSTDWNPPLRSSSSPFLATLLMSNKSTTPMLQMVGPESLSSCIHPP